MSDKNLTAVQSQILLSPKRQQSRQYVNVGRGDLVCAVKNQGIPVHHHRPDQGAIRQGKDHCKKLLIVWHPKNTTSYYVPGVPIFFTSLTIIIKCFFQYEKMQYPPDKTVPQNIGIVAEVQQEILPFVFPGK